MNVTTRGLFREQIRKRQQAWSQAKVSARITVPDELSWWYWNEFGTASKADPGRGSGAPYPIEPVNGKALVFQGRAGTVITSRVDAHPGVRPSRSVAESRQQIDQVMRDAVAKAIAQSADKPELVQEALQSAARQAVEIIGEAMNRNLQPSRDGDSEFPNQAGRLGGGGRRAGDVFVQNAQIVVE